MLRLVFLFFLLFVLTLGFSQTSVGIKTVTIDGEKQINDSLIEEKARLLLSDISDTRKKEINQELKAILRNELTKEAAFGFPFNKVESISILTPKDSAFRLFNWSLLYQDGSHSYECGILKKEINGSNFYFLNPIQNDSIDIEQFTGNKDEWPGGLYYEIIENKNKFQTYYTLLTWEGSDLLLNKKRIEVLWFDKLGNAKFGAPLFKSNMDTKYRIEFKFGGQNSMRLYRHSSLNRIVFDHLAPPKADSRNTTRLDGVYEYYGADLSFDAYDWERGYWVLKSNINPEETNEKLKDKNPSLKQMPSEKDFIKKENMNQVKKVVPR